MKKIYCIFIYLFIIVSLSAQKKEAAISDLVGRTFVGKPVKEVSEPGCEGCGEPGYIKFENNRSFELAWPGSDEIESGTYQRKGRKIFIRIGDNSKALIYYLSKDGIELRSEDGRMIFRDEKHPWKMGK